MIGRSLPCLAALLAACATGGGAPAPTAAPITDQDPPPYAPRPEEQASTGRVTAVALSGSHDQARRLALEVFEAVRAADADRLRELLPEQVARVSRTGYRGTVGRSIVIDRILRMHRRTSGTPRGTAEEMLRLDQMQVRHVRPPANGELNPRVRTTDLVVFIPKTPDGNRQLHRWYSDWRSGVTFVIRPGARPRLVAM